MTYACLSKYGTLACRYEYNEIVPLPLSLDREGLECEEVFR
jgi:hypothetical protein